MKEGTTVLGVSYSSDGDLALAAAILFGVSVDNLVKVGEVCGNEFYARKGKETETILSTSDYDFFTRLKTAGAGIGTEINVVVPK